MEEEAEKMAALKRAYADIILNTAKESAARVLAAERRALGFQQSLFAAKEEAVATMLRLKTIMEDKIREAEKEALYQAKKIDELELQLGEAEDTIVDLREDLKKVREELMMIKNGSVCPLSEGNINEISMASKNVGKETSTDNLNELGNTPIISNNVTSLTQKTTDTDLCCLRNAEKAEYPKEFSEGESPGNTDLASIIWSKVPELYRKGYTQRIHALDHNLTSSKGSFCENNDLQIPCKTDSAISDNRTTQVKDTLMFEETQEETGFCRTVDTEQEPGCSGKVYSMSSGGFSSPRKKRMINNQSNAFPDGIFSDELMPCIISSKFTVHDNWNVSEAPKETPAPFIGGTTEDKKSFAEVSTERESLMLNRCTRLDASIKMERMEIKQCTKGISCQNFQKQNQSVCEDKFLQNSLCNSEYANDSLLERTFSIEEDLENRRKVAVDSKEEEENLTENSDDCNTLKIETKDMANGTAQTGTDKFLKYTFQRKRKKGFSPTKNEIVFAEKKPTLKPKSMDKQNSVPVSSKSSLSTDLPRDNRRLVQVARQLISLSEKRW